MSSAAVIDMLHTGTAAATTRRRGGLEPYWLPAIADFAARMKLADAIEDPADAWAALVALANTRLDFIETMRLDRSLQRRFSKNSTAETCNAPRPARGPGSSTLAHLLPAIRVAALRRGLWMTTHEGEYGQYRQELADSSSELHAFRPDTVLFAFDAPHLLRGASPGLGEEAAATVLEAALAQLRQCWRQAREAFGCQVIQQTVLSVFPPCLAATSTGCPAHARASQRVSMRRCARRQVLRGSTCWRSMTGSA